jgi:hypothetical protein
LPQNLDGKEGVVGSSPTRGLRKTPANTCFLSFYSCRDGRRRSHVSAVLGELRSAASENPCRCGSCTTLSMPTGREVRRGSRVAETAAHAKHLHTAPPDHRQLQSVRSGDWFWGRVQSRRALLARLQVRRDLVAATVREVPPCSGGCPRSGLVRIRVEFGATPDELSLPTAVVRRTLRTWRRRTTRPPRTAPR